MTKKRSCTSPLGFHPGKWREKALSKSKSRQWCAAYLETVYFLFFLIYISPSFPPLSPWRHYCGHASMAWVNSIWAWSNCSGSFHIVPVSFHLQGLKPWCLTPFLFLPSCTQPMFWCLWPLVEQGVYFTFCPSQWTVNQCDASSGLKLAWAEDLPSLASAIHKACSS